MSRRNATRRTAIGMGLLVLALFGLGSSPAWARTAGRVVRFHGYRVTVPASWPVYHLARRSTTCVRFDRHAVYLGAPSANQRCPAHAAGHTEAILVELLGAGTASVRGPSGAAATVAARPTIVPGGESAASFVVPSAGLLVTATWSRDRQLISNILHRRVHGSSPARSAREVRIHASLRPLALSSASSSSRAAAFSGLGFDACSAPSTQAMSAWSSSPYRAVGVYVGGVNAACSQPSLSAAWVRREVAAGWHLIPTYVGLQGAGSCGGTCATITPSKAAAEGAAAAADAVAQARALGIPAGNPIYDDMEQYNRSSSNSATVLAFLSGWTTQLHADRYVSGVYSSASSGITDLAAAEGTGYTEPDDIWIADWNNRHTTADPYVPSSDWPNAHRLHQYVGGHDETRGGFTINIDGDFVDGATAPTTNQIPDGTFVQVVGSPEVYRMAGGAPLYVSSWSPFGGPQTVKMITAKQFSALSPYPADGTFLSSTSGLTYRVAGGAPIEVTSWQIFHGPQPSVMVDQWDLQNISNPLAHLEVAPVSGTVVEGLPSGSYYSFCDGYRSPASADPAAVAVDDQGLNAFPSASTAVTGGVGAGCGAPHPRTTGGVKCVVPQLRHMSLTRARSALGRGHCRLGSVRRPRHWARHHLLRVFGQSAAPRSRHRVHFAVAIRLL
jgi:Domain of unknown function (DUF1906)